MVKRLSFFYPQSSFKYAWVQVEAPWLIASSLGLIAFSLVGFAHPWTCFKVGVFFVLDLEKKQRLISVLVPSLQSIRILVRLSFIWHRRGLQAWHDFFTSNHLKRIPAQRSDPWQDYYDDRQPEKSLLIHWWRYLGWSWDGWKINFYMRLKKQFLEYFVDFLLMDSVSFGFVIVRL